MATLSSKICTRDRNHGFISSLLRSSDGLRDTGYYPPCRFPLLPRGGAHDPVQGCKMGRGHHYN